MSSRSLINLVLLIIVTILVTIVVIEPGKEAPMKPVLLTNVDPGQVNYLYIQRQADKQDIELVKSSSGWKMQKPYRLPANQHKIEALLKILNSETHSQHDLSGLKDTDYGFDSPRAKITVKDNSDKKTDIIFGHNKSMQTHRYLKVNNTMHMMMDRFHYQVSGKAEGFIEHKLIPEGRITKIDLPAFSLKQVDGKWEVSNKNINNYSADNISKLVSEWQISQAYDIEKSSRTKFKKDIGIIIDAQPVNFEIIPSDNDFILLRHDNQLKYILSGDRKDALLSFTDEAENAAE